ncbi:MAG: hypothetical protein MUF22_01665 [Chitinispirillaceae bacterium]|nr:hypothetical protein [Chitinispirillaceae bacterium]
MDERGELVLPLDEAEAEVWLAEGAIDSVLWKKIEPLYVMPLSVPGGELAILESLFPDLAASLPTTPDQLALYQPWDQGSISLFFHDYPELVLFKPILAFERVLWKSPGSAGFSFSRWRDSDSARYYAAFCAREKALSATGRVDFSATYGRWYRRVVSFSPSQSSVVSLGNFSPRNHDRLFLGRFASSSSDTSPRDSWLYGNSKTWNGILVRSSSSEAFFHVTQSERILSASTTAMIAHWLSFTGSVSELMISGAQEAQNSYFYASTGVKLAPIKAFIAELQCGFDAQSLSRIPLSLSWRHASGNSDQQGEITLLPKRFFAPGSEAGRLLLARSGMKDTASQRLIGADLSFAKRQWEYLGWSPRLSTVFAGEQLRYLSAGLVVSGKCTAWYRLSYSWSPVFRGIDTPSFRHTGSLSLSCPVSRRVTLESSQSVYYQSSGYWRHGFVVSPRVILEALELAPIVMVSKRRGQPLSGVAGLRQHLTVSPKTVSDITVEQPLPFASVKFVTMKGRMNFLF